MNYRRVGGGKHRVLVQGTTEAVLPMIYDDGNFPQAGDVWVIRVSYNKEKVDIRTETPTGWTLVSSWRSRLDEVDVIEFYRMITDNDLNMSLYFSGYGTANLEFVAVRTTV